MCTVNERLDQSKFVIGGSIVEVLWDTVDSIQVQRLIQSLLLYYLNYELYQMDISSMDKIVASYASAGPRPFPTNVSCD